MGRWVSKPPLGTPIDSSHDLAQGLVGAWLFNEGAGLRANDGSGYGNHGTLTNMAFPPTPTSGWNPGKDGHALAFNGINTQVVIGNLSMLLGDTGTLVMMVRPKDEYGYIFSGGNIDNTKLHLFFQGLAFRYYVGDGVLRIGSAVIANRWYHIALTWTLGVDYLYKDGVLDINYTHTINPVISNAKIGDYPTNGYALNGLISFVFAFNRVLQPSEITQLYADSYCFLQQPRNVKYFWISVPTEVYSSRGIGRGILRGIMR